MKIKLNKKTYVLLCEALRRAVCFGLRDGKGESIETASLTHYWTGLGYPSTYKPAIKAGLMDSVNLFETPRVNNWYQLTPKGAAIVKQWCLEGYGPDEGSFELSSSPPMEFELTETQPLPNSLISKTTRNERVSKMEKEDYLDGIWMFDRAKSKTGEIVPINEKEFDYLLNVLPPAHRGGYYAMREALDSRDGQNVYLWFGEGWMFEGTYKELLAAKEKERNENLTTAS